MAVAPEAWSRLSRLVHEIEHGRPDRGVPQRHVRVAAIIHELLKLPVRDRVAVEIHGLDMDQSFAMRVRFVTVAAVPPGLQQHVTLGHDSHGVIQRADGGLALFLLQIRRDLRSQQQGVASLVQHALWPATLGSFSSYTGLMFTGTCPLRGGAELAACEARPRVGCVPPSGMWRDRRHRYTQRRGHQQDHSHDPPGPGHETGQARCHDDSEHASHSQ